MEKKTGTYLASDKMDRIYTPGSREGIDSVRRNFQGRIYPTNDWNLGRNETILDSNRKIKKENRKGLHQLIPWALAGVIAAGAITAASVRYCSHLDEMSKEPGIIDSIKKYVYPPETIDE